MKNQREFTKKTKIVCTIGPASQDPGVLRAMMEAGMNVARLNFSHGSYDEHREKINCIKAVRKELGFHTAILLDTKGPEIRTGPFDIPEALLTEGQLYTLSTDPAFPGNEAGCSVSYAGLVREVGIGSRILADDGLIEMEVVSAGPDSVTCRVLNTGVIKANKGINIPGAELNLPAVTDRDYRDILFGIENEVDFIAASFVRKRADVEEIRTLLKHNGGAGIRIIAKIENGQGVENIDDILEAADGIMVARGDLGVEIRQELVPVVQKRIIKKCNNAGKPVITATQMLDSMIRNPRPTRAEVADVANAIFDGTDAVMLSGETAAGKYPAESVLQMSEIARAVEKNIDYEEIMRRNIALKDESITNAIGYATVISAHGLKARAILTPTASGGTPTIVSKFRPKVPIFATSHKEEVARRLSLVWGVEGLIINEARTEQEIFAQSVAALSRKEKIRRNDILIITAGLPAGVEGNTNMMRVHVAGKEL